MQHHPALGHHAAQQQPSGYGMEDARQHHLPHRSPYHQSPMSEEMYHRGEHAIRSYADIGESIGSGSIARPVVTYSNEMVTRSYDTAMVNSASHRPYDPGS